MKPVKYVLCPRCQTDTEARLIYCSKCGAQLVEPHLSEYGPGIYGCIGTTCTYMALPTVFFGFMLGWGWFVEFFEKFQRLISVLKAPNAFAFLLLGGTVTASLLFLLLANKAFKK